jgi:DNA polymerase-1
VLEEFQQVEWFCLDCETLSLYDYEEVGGLRCVQLAAPGCETVLFDLHKAEQEELKAFQEGLRRCKGIWWAHNAAFDYAWLERYKMLPAGPVACTMLAARLLTAGLGVKVNLADVVARFLKKELDKTMQKADWRGLLTPAHREYAIRDVETLVELVPVLQGHLKKAELVDASTLEMIIIPSIVEMQRNGMPFSRDALESLEKELIEEEKERSVRVIEVIQDWLPWKVVVGKNVKKGEFNMGSPSQLLRVLTDILKFEPKDPVTGKPSVSRSALREYAADHVVVQEYLKWKKVEKYRQMAGTLIEECDCDRIHAGYMQIGADTGRFSCREPNLQQVPRDRRFRNAAIAPDGWVFVVADYSQLELRLVAAETKDENMMRAFEEGKDLHQLTASVLYGVEEPSLFQRQIAKSANFGLVYGAGARGLRLYAGACGIMMTLEEATKIRDQWLKLYDGVAKWHKECDRMAKAKDMSEVRVDGTGFRRWLTSSTDRMTVRANTRIQGAGAAVLKQALAYLWSELEFGSAELCAVVHDEIVLLAPEGEGEFWRKKLMEVMVRAEDQWLKSLVPSEVSAGVGKAWGLAK